MDKIKKYLECYIPTETCNLRCHYCYIALLNKFNNKITKFNYTPKEIRTALSKKRLGGTCLINLCAGGETLISQEVISIIEELLKEGHYITLVTNGTLTKRFEQISKFSPDLLKRLFFKFSFHYLELIRMNMLDQYFENINRMKVAGCSFTVEITPSDELIPHIEDIKNVCMEKLGALCHVTIARDDRKQGIEILSKYNLKEYQKIWGEFNSELFDYKTKIFYKKRDEFCYAGDWSLYINLGTGSVRQCYVGKELDNIYEQPEKPIKTKAVGKHCTQPHCYNGHSFLTLGNIPELEAPTLAKVRDRIDNEGNNWLNKEMNSFMNQKLRDNNLEYTTLKKYINHVEHLSASVSDIPTKAMNKLKNIF